MTFGVIVLVGLGLFEMARTDSANVRATLGVVVGVLIFLAAVTP